MTYYGTTATAAGLVVPKKYVTQVGDEGFRKNPVGAGPYKFVSHTPGVEIVPRGVSRLLAARAVRERLVMKSVPDGTHAGGHAEDRRGGHRVRARRPGRREREAGPAPADRSASRHASINWLEFPRSVGSKSPWADKRLRLAVIHRSIAGHQRGRLVGYCPPTGVIYPRVMNFALQPSPGLRSGEIEAAAGRGGYPKASRRRRLTPIRRSSRWRSRFVNYTERRRHPREDGASWSARPSTPLAREEAA